MLSFWANIDESDIEAFAGTLLLPPYMSHLSLAPFQFVNQPPNFDGRQPLVLTYIAEGRVEELPISPKKHALALLHYSLPSLAADSVKLPGREAIWNWASPPPPGNFSSHTLNVPPARKPPGDFKCRIFFEPVRKSLNPDRTAPVFSPFQTYVSVSRRELFIGMQVFSAYFQAWIAQLTGSEVPPDDGEPDSLPSASFCSLEPTANGIGFSTDKIGGELLVEEDFVFPDLLRFAGLNAPLAEIAPLVVPDLNSPDTQIGEAGALLRLVPNPKAAANSSPKR